MNYRMIVAGAIGGFISAVLVDLHAWRDGVGLFDWKKAISRWVGGAVSGALAAIGISTGGA